MTAPVILNEFSDSHPFSVTELNAVLRALAGAINSLGGQQLLQFNPAGGNQNTDYVPASGGDFLGTITAPALLIGPAEGTKHPVVTQGTPATATEPGAVLQGAAVAALALTISNPPTQAQVQAIHDKLNELRLALVNAGVLA